MQMGIRMLSDRLPQTKSTCAGYVTRHTVEGTAAFLAIIAKSQDLTNLTSVGPNLVNQMLIRIKEIEVQAQSDLKKANSVEGDRKQRNLRQGQEKPETMKLTETLKPHLKQTQKRLHQERIENQQPERCEEAQKSQQGESNLRRPARP